jgi:hypothetical protein
LQVADSDYLRRVTLTTASGGETTIYLGSAPSYNATHVRVAGSDDAYLATNLTSWEFSASPSSWIDTTFVEVDRNKLVEVRITNPKGTVVLIEASEGQWFVKDLEGEQDSDKVSSALVRASSVLTTKPLGRDEKPDYGMSEPVLSVTLVTDEESITWEAGAQVAAEAGYVVRSSTSPYYVIVADYNITTLLENGAQDYLRPPATPTVVAPATN